MIRALAFHTERLHDDRVWKRLLLILAIMRHLGSRATFFVYPFRAVVSGRDISDRVRALAVDHKQEIGQHTHFYAGSSLAKPNKRNDLTPENIRNCIERDFEWLCRISKPKGFTSGGWMVTDAVYPALMNLGFDYDCSARVPALRKEREAGPNLWLTEAEQRVIRDRPLILVPTTHTLRNKLLGTRRLTSSLKAGVAYQLVYLHDYDLLRPRVLLGLSLALMASRTFLCVDHLARKFSQGESGG